MKKVPWNNAEVDSEGEELPGEAVEVAYQTFCSFAFQMEEVMKADGELYMYIRENDPEQRGTIIGFDKRFIAMPIRNKGIGAIVSAMITPDTVTLTFDSQGGNNISSKTINYGDAVGVLPTPTLAENTFDGWFTEPNGDGTEYTEETVATVSVKLYANWTTEG